METKKGYVAIAISPNYGTIGDEFRITLDSGVTFYAVMADTKSLRHLHNGCDDSTGAIIEFLVCTEKLDDQIRLSGSIGGIYPGNIIKIERRKRK